MNPKQRYAMMKTVLRGLTAMGLVSLVACASDTKSASVEQLDSGVMDSSANTIGGGSDAACSGMDCVLDSECGNEPCPCEPGYQFMEGACQDIDECETNNGGCSQRCGNQEGEHICLCESGYELNTDGISCDATGPCPGCTICGDQVGIDGLAEAARVHFQALTVGVPENPISVVLAEDTNGTLNLTTHPHAVPIVTSDAGVFVAASQLGAGRVVAFSGQDFLSSGVRSTLLGEAGVRKLIVNAVDWVSPGIERADLKVLAANGVVGDLLRESGVSDVGVARVRFVQGLEAIRDWHTDALNDVDVAIITVNEWGTSHIAEVDVEHIRRFVSNGGGLLIAGSALHWSWWLDWTAAENQGNAILDGAGIAWEKTSVRGVDQGQVRYDALGTPSALWCGYIAGMELSPAQYARLGPLFPAAFESQRIRELDFALVRLLAETPALPVDKTNPRARLSADVGVSLTAHTWPSEHPWAAVFPGTVDGDAARISQTVTMDGQWKRIRPLGLYAAPGEAITVRLDPVMVDAGLRIQLGELYDDLRNLDHIVQWRRPPLLVSHFDLDQDEVLVGNGFGGSLYLQIPEDLPSTAITLEVEGAIRQGFFSEGQVNSDEFKTGLTMGAPLAILEHPGKIRMVLSASAASQIQDPSSITTFWTGFYDSHRTLSAEPVARTYESHWLFDPQVGWGYANATPSRINFPEEATGWALRTRTGDEDWWLFAHELGHQFQTDDWSGGDITEVAVNLFSMYTINGYLHEGGDQETRGFQDNVIDHDSLRNSRWDSADLFGKLAMYRQLVFEFGWSVFRAVFASYYSSDFPRDRFDGFMDGFAIRFSAIAQRDITPFLDHWAYPLSEQGRNRVLGMGLQPWLPPGW
jgi:hypothetical protein